MKTLKTSFLILSIALLLTACEPAISTDPNSINVDGQTATWQQGGIGWSASIGANYTVTYQSSFVKTSSYPSITLGLGEHVYSTYMQADFFAFFTTGTKTFAVDPSEVGFSVYYNEGSSGPTWSSAIGRQSGSSVTFNSFTQQPTNGFTPDRVKYNVAVNAKVYNTTNSSDVKTISGTFEGSFERYYISKI